MKEFLTTSMLCRRTRLALMEVTVIALMATSINRVALCATKYWDVSAGAGNGVGGTGTWTAQTTAIFSNTSTGDAALSAAATTDDDIFQGTAGIITLGTTLVANSFTFNTTGYTLNATTSRTLTGPVTLAAGVNLSITSAAGSIFTLGSVTGGTSGSSLTLAGSTAAATDFVRVSLSNGSVIAASSPISITTTGTGISGFTSSVTNATINADITNNSTTSTVLGASSGNGITMGGAFKGSAAVIFEAAASGGGAGTITLNGSSSNTGDTRFNGTASGAVKLGIDNAISTNSGVVMGYTSGNGQKLDLNGHNQTVASLASNVGTGSITSSASGTGTDTLTIKGAATTSFALTIVDGTTRKVALTLDSANTGLLQLSGANTYTGGTNVNGGTLQMGNTNALATTGSLTVGGGKVDIFGYATSAGVVTLNGGSIINSDANFQTVGVTGSSFLVSSGTASAILAGSGAVLTKSSGSTVTLSGANTYTGGTSVNAGVLVISNANGSSATGTGSVTVANNPGTVLTGLGYINASAAGANITVNGTLSPGSAAAVGNLGTIHLQTTGALTLSSVSTLAFDLTSVTSKDLVALTNTSLSLGGGTLALNLPNMTSTGIDYTKLTPCLPASAA